MKHNKKTAMISGQQGFTLIELMIVVAIVAIISAIAFPAYRNHVVKANRTAAESFMMQVADKEEQYLLDARTYTSTIVGAGGLNMTIPPDVARNYTVTITPVATASTYTVQAVPINPPQNDTECGTLTLDQLGVKKANGVKKATCW